MNCFRINILECVFCVLTRASLILCYGYFVFNVFPLCYCLVVSTSAVDCLERLVSEMTYCVLSGMLRTHFMHIHYAVCQLLLLPVFVLHFKFLCGF